MKKQIYKQTTTRGLGDDANRLRIKNAVLDSHSTLTAWALSQGFNKNLVYKIINAKRKALRGQSRTIAKALERVLISERS